MKNKNPMIPQENNKEGLQNLIRGIEQSTATVLITDTEGIIEYVNPRFTEVTGYTPEECLGENVRMLKSGKTPPETYRHLWKNISAGLEWRGEFCNQKKNGQLIWEYATVSPIKNAAGEITHFIGIMENISELKKTEIDLVRAREDAEAVNRAKSSFFAGLTHELRTPMNAIIGYSDLMQEIVEELGVEKELGPDIEKVNIAAKHLLGLINNILDFSKLEAGKMTLNIEKFDVTGLLDEARAVIEPLAAKNKNRFEYTVVHDPGFLQADRKKLFQVLINLLSNACKFTENGVVSVEVDALKEKGNDWVWFSVRDTGIGLTPDQIKVIFLEFTQAESSISKTFGGTGLGLSLSRSFCRLMGGDIEVKSEYGKGSTFTAKIPREVQINGPGR